MSGESSNRDFPAFTRWVAKRFGSRTEQVRPSEELVTAARDARDEILRATQAPDEIEVLTVMAAADFTETMPPATMTTARGYRVSFAFDESGGANASRVCVLVQCPERLIGCSEGRSPALWKGALQFELGQFDADGKAIGTLPAGVDITLADLAQGQVKLQEPSSADVV
jgi:hypothetical protein